MAEVHLNIPDQYVRDVQETLNDIWMSSGRPEKYGRRELTPNQIFGEALAVYQWVLDQTKANRAVVSTSDFISSDTQLKTRSIPAIDPAEWKRLDDTPDGTPGQR